MLCACLSDGVILHMEEIYGCESLSQRYVSVAAVKALMPSLCVVVHDDACHLHKYAARRAKDRMLGKELLSGLWVRPECRSYCCPSHIRSCLTCYFTVLFVSPLSLRPGVVGVCFEVPGWEVMPYGCALWSLGSWLGGSWVSALCVVASLTPLYGPFCSRFLVCFCFVFEAVHDNLQSAEIEHVKQPGESHEGVGRKKNTDDAGSQREWWNKQNGEIAGETWSNVRRTAVATALRAHSKSAQ